MTGGRRKCMLRACPHHHYALDSIGGLRVVPLRFPTDDSRTREKWLQFVQKHNKTEVQLRKDHYLCSAHFLPRFIFQRGPEGFAEKFAVPSISPRTVWDLAIDCGDMRPMQLDECAWKDSPPLVFLEESMKNLDEIEHGSSVCVSVGNPHSRKRNHLGELSVNDSCCPHSSKVAFQCVTNNLLKIWSGYGVQELSQGDLGVMIGSEMQVVKKCDENCYKVD